MRMAGWESLQGLQCSVLTAQGTAEKKSPLRERFNADPGVIHPGLLIRGCSTPK